MIMGCGCKKNQVQPQQPVQAEQPQTESTNK